MAAKLRNILMQARKVFDKPDLIELNMIEDAEFQNLTALVNNLSFQDVGFPPKHLHKNGNLKATNPIDHVPLYEDQLMQVGVFILKQGAKIPLHDHPGMHGIIKVIRGAVKVTSFNIKAHPRSNESGPLYYNKPLEVTRNPPVVISEESDCSILTPLKGNVHEVVCVNGPAAFLDILAPPYDDDQYDSLQRSCHYFKESSPTDEACHLIQISNPGEFWYNQDNL